MKNNKFSRHLHTMVCIAVSSLLYTCAIDTTGIEVGNPATVVGCVKDGNNHNVVGADVFLVTPAYNAVTDSASFISVSNDSDVFVGQMTVSNGEQCIYATTDANGIFTIKEVSLRKYNILIADSTQTLSVFRQEIRIDKDAINLGNIDLKNSSYGTISINDTVFRGSGYVIIPGTPIKIVVDTSGIFTIPLLGDTLKVLYFDQGSNSLSSLINKVLPTLATPVYGDTLDLTGIEHVLIPPTMAFLFGMDTLYTPQQRIYIGDTTYTVAALGAFSNKGHLLEYQFFEPGINVLSNWSNRNTYQLYVDSTGVSQVACRVRSQRDNTVITTWTPALSMSTILVPDTQFVSKPFTPVLIDTLPYSFTVGGAVSSDAASLAYRLGWLTDSQMVTTNWSFDTIISVDFTTAGLYPIQAQARSEADTNLLSDWSDTLLCTVNRSLLSP